MTAPNYNADSTVTKTVPPIVGTVLPVDQKNPPAWQTGLCQCCTDCGICAQTFFCCPCTCATMANYLDTDTQTCSCGVCCGACCTCCHCCACTASSRRQIIERYGIRGESMCSTCCLDCCCGACTMCQVQREMHQRGNPIGGCCGPKLPPNGGSMVAPPAPLGLPVDQLGPSGFVPLDGKWSTGLCSCTANECIEGWFCSCCVWARVSARLSPENALNDETGFDVAVCLFAWCAKLPFMIRRQTMERFQIKDEGRCASCCKVCCCGPCASLQTRREHGVRGVYPGGLCMKEMPPPPPPAVK